MKIRLKILLTLFIIIGSKSASAQIGSVIVMNSDTDTDRQTILVKWYIDEVSCKEGVNIYRQNKGSDNWKKVNSEPYKFIRPVPKDALKEDPSLQEYIDLFDETPHGELKSIVLLNVLLKSIESDIYAKYIGILFEDRTAIRGETYSYKVMKIESGSEKLIGISPEIRAGDFEPTHAPEDIKTEAGSHRAFMVWKPELQRYHAINIFRSSSIDPEEKQLNEYPIMLSQKVNEDGTMTIPEPYFTDIDLENNVTYHYRLQALDYFGRESELSDTVSVLIKDLIPPLPPYRLRAEQENLKTGLIWMNDTSSDLHGMNVYRSSDDSLYQKINKELLAKSDTSYLDIAEKSGVYFYYVSAVDIQGNEARSPKLMVEIPDIIPPEKPKGFTALADTGQIHLSWKPNTDEDLMGYIVYRRIKGKKNKDFAPVFADPINQLSYSDHINKVARNYFEYTLAAIDSSYNVSEYSHIVYARMPDVLPPNKPKFKKTHLEENGVLHEWIPNLDPDLAGYDIFRKEKTDTLAYIKLNKALLPPNKNTYLDVHKESGKIYYYKLCAVDSAGNRSLLSHAFTGAIKKPEITDSSSLKKISVTYNQKKQSVKIKWKTKEETTCKGSVLYRKEEGQSFKPITALVKETNYTDTNIIENKTYYYQVRIYETNGKIIKSDTEEIKTNSNN